MEVTMEENLEIEFKILLDKKVYDQIINDYSIDTSYTQTNYYLMHPILTKLKYSLRIREKNNQYELTLKQPQTTGSLETNLIINKDAKDKILNNKFVLLYLILFCLVFEKFKLIITSHYSFHIELSIYYLTLFNSSELYLTPLNSSKQL